MCPGVFPEVRLTFPTSPGMSTPDPVTEPFPIFKLAYRYLLYDVDTIYHVRAKYNITGVLIGCLPQAPQQNVFSGVPVELMPEEARLLVEKGVACVVDDVKIHKQGFLDNGLGKEQIRAYRESLRRQGAAVAGHKGKQSAERKKAALSKKMEVENWNDIPQDMLERSSTRTKNKPKKSFKDANQPATNAVEVDGNDNSLFDPNPDSRAAKRPGLASMASDAIATMADPFGVTPTVSYPPLSSTLAPPKSPCGTSESIVELPYVDSSLPDVPSSYSIFKHLHEKGYFLAPGLRFGCQYMAYPGDPLRFHSHFLCNGLDWDQEFDLLDLVGGGRLGTGVKKGFLIGGEVKQGDVGRRSRIDESEHKSRNGKDFSKEVRSFCIEWGGM